MRIYSEEHLDSPNVTESVLVTQEYLSRSCARRKFPLHAVWYWLPQRSGEWGENTACNRREKTLAITRKQLTT